MKKSYLVEIEKFADGKIKVSTSLKNVTQKLLVAASLIDEASGKMDKTDMLLDLLNLFKHKASK